MARVDRAPTPEEVRAELRRILACGPLGQSQALRRFLCYTVEETLQGRQEGLKELVLGTQVFGRSADFDPRIDPIVRVQAGKLRGRLKEYYEHEGSDDPVRIAYPKGGYVPLFRVPLSRQASRSRPRFRHWWWVAALVAVAGSSLGVWTSLRQAGVKVPSSAVRLTADTGSTTFPAISRDGRFLAYASDRASPGNLDIWIQPLGGGEAVRLTTHPTMDRTPDISPDGSLIVFRSERDGGGIYAVDVLNRKERLLADRAWLPRFSADGSRIVFQGEGPDKGGSLYAMSPDGGRRRRIGLDPPLGLIGGPVFTPDGKHILFLARDSDERLDWWVVPAAGGRAVPTGVADRLSRNQVPPLSAHAIAGDWIGTDMVFALQHHESANLWRIPFSPGEWRAAGPPRRVTIGTAQEENPRASAAGRVVFTSELTLTQLWSVLPSLTQITNDSSLLPGNSCVPHRFSVRGNMAAFSTRRSNNPDVWLRDVVTGVETPVAASPASEEQPVIAMDGRQVAWRSQEGGNSAVFAARIPSGPARKIADGCDILFSWSAAGLFCGENDGAAAVLVRPESGRREPVYNRPGWRIKHLDVTPDGRRALFTMVEERGGMSHAWVVPMRGALPAGPSAWMKMPEVNFEGAMHWAGNGSAAYYFSKKDGFLCLWKQRVAESGRPLGESTCVRHFHTGRWSPWDPWIAVSGELVAAAQTEVVSNIWSLQLK